MGNFRKTLEKFVINNEKLELLEDTLKEFNIFETLGLQYYEIRHSNTIAFLCNPSANHGLGDYFLKKFLISTVAEADTPAISPITIDGWDFSDAVVKREYRNIDILLVSRSNQFVCCIENKVLSTESNDQLSRYKSIVDSEFPGYRNRLFIFLSPLGVEPSDPENWLISNYEIIAGVLKYIVDAKLKDVGSQQGIFIQHYNTIVRRYLLENSDDAKLARDIYAAHKTALDFIFKNISDSRQDLYDQIKNILENPHGEFLLLYSTLSRIRFTMKSLDKILPKIGDRRWNGIEQVFVFELINNADSVSLVLIMGPTDQSYRSKALETLKKDFIPKYLKYKVSMNEMYNTIYKKTIISKDEYVALDIDEKKARIAALFDSTLNNDFRNILTYFQNNIDQFKWT